THAANLGIQFLQPPRGSNKGAARTESCDEISDATGSLLPNLICRGAVMRLPVRRIAVLVGVKVFVRLRSHDLVYFTNRTVGAFVARSNHQFCTIGSQDAFA